jgi:hypothetical protein
LELAEGRGKGTAPDSQGAVGRGMWPWSSCPRKCPHNTPTTHRASVPPTSPTAAAFFPFLFHPQTPNQSRAPMAIAQRVVRSTATRGCAIQRNLVAYRPHKGGGLQQSRAHADPAFAAWMRSSCQQLCGGCKLQKGASTIAWCKGTPAIAWCIGVCQQLCDLLTAGANQALNFSNRLKVAGMIIQQCIREYSAIEHPLTFNGTTSWSPSVYS